MGRVLVTVLLAGALVAAVAYYFDLIPAVPTPGSGNAAAAQNDREVKATFKEPLYPVAPFPKEKQVPLDNLRDPIVITGQLNAKQQVDIACTVDGRLAFIGEEVPEGTTAVAGIAPFVTEPYRNVRVNQGERQPLRFFRLLNESQVVLEGQMVALVDPSKALQEVAKAEAKLDVAKAQLDSAKSTEDEALVRLKRATDLRARGAIGEEEWGLNKLTYVKSKADTEEKRKAIEVAQTERNGAMILLRDHEIRNNIQSHWAIIKKVYHKGMESIKNGEPILQLYSLDKLEAQADVDSQYVRRMQEGKKVTIEPQHEESPVRKLAGHRAEVTSVAVTKDFPKPLYVSGSEDKTVRVWDPEYQGDKFPLDHPDAVKVVACSPPAAKHNLILSGCADGSIHLWNLADQGKADFTRKAARKSPNAHRDAITALAFSPDGKYFATGGADNQIKIWETEGDFTKPLYVFDYEHGVTNPHQGAITSLHFTPQGKLVSAARDNTLRVWTLYKDGAKAHGELIAYRSGNVGQLGASADGRWMLFDHGKMLQVLSVETGQFVNSIQNPAGGIPFETLAVFSPDASLILTAGASQGRLQLWKAPTAATRGYEVRQLTTDTSPVTSAAFSPYAGKSKDTSYAVSGAKDGSVYIWELPTQEDINRHRIENVTMSRISPSIDPTSRQVRIGVDLVNEFGPQFPGGHRLEPGRPVTIVIE